MFFSNDTQVKKKVRKERGEVFLLIIFFKQPTYANRIAGKENLLKRSFFFSISKKKKKNKSDNPCEVTISGNFCSSLSFVSILNSLLAPSAVQFELFYFYFFQKISMKYAIFI